MGFVRAAPRYLFCLLCVAALIWICYSITHVNATTVALAMLLVVLGIATRWGLPEAIFTSIAAMLGFNFFFLPPVGTFTIADPQNWVALFAFLTSAVVASQLSARAKRRTEEASARRHEIERLYSLSRAMLMDETTDMVRTALVSAGDIFGLRNLVFYDLDSGRVYGPAEPPHLTEAELARVAVSNEANSGSRFAIVPVRLGTRTIGSLGLEGRDLTQAERDSIANLIGINYERARALDRATAAEAARRGERLKTFLLDGIAHDLKTPLAAIKTCITALITIPPKEEQKRSELLSIIDEETDRLQRTITEAIQLSRIESGKIALERQRVRVREVLEGVLRGFAEDQRYVISTPEDQEISADPSLLQQAIRQLVENAQKYSPRASPIEIAAESNGEFLILRVLDRGTGVASNELDRIFDKFYRGTRARASVEGTGMGLAIAKGIIEAHGGSIWAENRPGGGSVFSVTLPISSA